MHMFRFGAHADIYGVGFKDLHADHVTLVAASVNTAAIPQRTSSQTS